MAETAEFQVFVEKHKSWLPEYCMYMALKDANGGASWSEWDEDIRLRKPEAVTHYEQALHDEIGFYQFLQYVFFTQWTALGKSLI